MAVNIRAGTRVGCAYYSAREEALYCMDDMEMSGPEAIAALQAYIAPTTILIPYNIDDAIAATLDPHHVEPDEDTGSVNILPYQLESRVSGEFAYESGRNKLLALRLPRSRLDITMLHVPGDDLPIDSPHNYGDISGARLGNMLTVGSTIELHSQLSVGCAGAIISHLQKRRSGMTSTIHDPFNINRLDTFTLNGQMLVNNDTLASLQIIQSESHPNAQNRGPSNSGSKEGLSAYGLFKAFVKTPQGKVKLRQAFLRPFSDLDRIQERLDSVSILLRSDNQPTMDETIVHLKSVKNALSFCKSLRKGPVGHNQTKNIKSGAHRTVWSSIREFLYRTIEIHGRLGHITGIDRLPIGKRIEDVFDVPALSELGLIITNTINFDETLETHRIVINRGIDQFLDVHKQTYDSLDSLLVAVAHRTARGIPAIHDPQINITFFPQLGFLVSVRLIPDTETGVYEGDENDRWEKMFATEEYAYYKNRPLREMDHRYGDVYAKMRDREVEILQDLADEVLKYEHLLMGVSDLCGELDLLFALAQSARAYDLCRPNMTMANVIDIREGRHMLQERTVPTFIPNDTFVVGGDGDDSIVASDPEDPTMLMITGPNYSGKSVYLKQVALITFMAHIGSFVPAKSATIGLTDKIFTRIWTRESVSRHQSAFMIDLQQMCLALSLATERSLIIIDEFGKGTDSRDGAGLAAGVFMHLLNRGQRAPKVIAATHFHEIFEHNHVRHPRLSFQNMKVLLPRNMTRDSASVISTATTADEVTYLYSLEPGRTSGSYGSVCASMNGIPGAIVQRAEELIDIQARGEDIVSACAVIGEQEKEDLVLAEAVAKKFLLADFRDEAREKLDRILGPIDA